MNYPFEKRRRPRADTPAWEVIDVDLAYPFFATTREGRDSFQHAIELLGHRCLVKEIKV